MSDFDKAFDLGLIDALVCGGDDRITLGATQVNRYGTPAKPDPDAVWLSSSTASAISPGGYRAARAAFQALKLGTREPAMWFDAIRRRLLRLYGIDGAEAVLCASGTEAEFLALHAARAVLGPCLRNIVIAPKETGSGVMHAAAGQHFSTTGVRGDAVVKGDYLDGFDCGPADVHAVSLRDDFGLVRTDADLDAEIETLCADAELDEQGILLHALDCSKTGLAGPRRETLARLAARFGERLLVVVDACQLRCPPETIKAHLSAGHFVMISGSKFAGGPPFCGALLIPPAHVAAIRRIRLPHGLGAYTTTHDWPLTLQAGLAKSGCGDHNAGLGLRWEAALHEIEAFHALPKGLRHDVTVAFGAAVEAELSAHPGLRAVLNARRPDLPERTIFPVVIGDGTAQAAATLCAGLRTPEAGHPVRYYFGQPVEIGSVSALRVCAGMPLITALCVAVLRGEDVRSALMPLRRDLAQAFAKLSVLDAERAAALPAAQRQAS
jgi:hypothetical protein